MIQDLSGSWCIKGTGEYITRVDSPVPLMHHDPGRSCITDPDPDHPKGTQPLLPYSLRHENSRETQCSRLSRGNLFNTIHTLIMITLPRITCAFWFWCSIAFQSSSKCLASMNVLALIVHCSKNYDLVLSIRTVYSFSSCTATMYLSRD